MPSVRIIETTAAQWGVPIPVPGVLHAACADHAPQQATGRSHAGRDRALSAKPWPGISAGVRAPEPWETPLSFEEVAHGVREGLLP